MSAVLTTPLYREPVEFRAVEAQSLTISNRGDGLYVVKSAGEYVQGDHVEFRGFFGSYGPEVFANAPALLSAVEDFLEAQDALDNREYQGINGEDYSVLMRRRNRARDDLDAAIAKGAAS
ncbi:hypothetical protein J2W34_000080 [Variovorax boronicumulans]|uniref:hypothetical protein n=1 Tax=Variovorax boronicumulans TaxID=436515 RepID=UPI00278A09A0|nr:hypothetical protein [Variovorax boronicumulans]MDQ0068306.1 hypothetical protein [Variovorax boronicumulans]